METLMTGQREPQRWNKAPRKGKKYPTTIQSIYFGTYHVHVYLYIDKWRQLKILQLKFIY